MSKKRITYPLQQVLASITLSADKRVIFEERYIHLIEDSYDRCRHTACLFHTNRIVITIGSIIVPALLSIHYTQSATSVSELIYWVTWAVSLLVTISNGILTLFKYDKKYFLFHATYEQLRTEGWQYLSLTGHYSGDEPKHPDYKRRNSILQVVTPHHPKTTHEIQFYKFMYKIEKIVMRQAQEQYIKLQDVNSATVKSEDGIPSLVDTKSPSVDDLVIKIAKLLQFDSRPKIGGPSDQDANKREGQASLSSAEE